MQFLLQLGACVCAKSGCCATANQERPTYICPLPPPCPSGSRRFTGTVQQLGAFEDDSHIYLVQESCGGGWASGWVGG